MKDVMEQMDDRATADRCDAAKALSYLEGVIERMLTAGLESNFVFETFRSGFTLCFKHQIERNLLPFNMHLSMLDVSETVRSTFIARLIENPQKLVYPALHGTFESNFPSISERGFLIPGAWNGIRMRNGCTYGRGIYFANINAPDLALSFTCSSCRLLVCALIKDDKVIRAVRDCQVVFDPSVCVPLFVARPAHCNTITELGNCCRHVQSSAREVLHRGYIMDFKVGNFLRKGVSVYQLLNDGYTAESLISGGYSAEDIFEERLGPRIRWVTFSELKRSGWRPICAGDNILRLWSRLKTREDFRLAQYSQLEQSDTESQ